MALIGSWIINVLYAIFALFVTFYLWAKYQHTYWKRRGIPSVSNAHWFFGNFKDGLLMNTNPGVVFGNLYHQGSEKDDVLGIYIMQKPYLLIRNVELVKQILVKDFNMFSDRYFAVKANSDPLGSNNLFSVNNPHWKLLRTRLSPAFSSGKQKNFFLLMVESAQTMETFLLNQCEPLKPKNILIKDIFSKYTTNVIASLAFGIRTNSFEEPEPQFYEQSMKAFNITFFRAIRFFFLFFFPQVAKYLGGQMLGDETDYFRKVFWSSMDNREMSKMKRGDVIDNLVDLKNQKQDDNFKLEGDVLLAQSAIFFIAGRETSITTMSLTLYELARNPEIQKKTRAEVLEKLESDGMTYEAVQSMKYLQQVINETLRLYPPAPLLDRVAAEDYKIPGSDIVIEKNTPVYVALYGIQTDPRYFKDPLRFDPDRFSEENKNDILPCSYIPFGEGPRICIGARMGALLTTVGLVTILKNFEISLTPGYACEIDRRFVFGNIPLSAGLTFTRVS